MASTGKSFDLVVVGSTGAVGNEVLRLIEDRRLPVGTVHLYASDRSAGEKKTVVGQQIVVQPFPPAVVPEADLVFFCGPPELSAEHVGTWVDEGVVVIDVSGGTAGMAEAVLVAPRINRARLADGPAIIQVASTVAGPLSHVIHPLAQAAGLRRVSLATYQAASTVGAAAMRDLSDQIVGILNQRPFIIKSFKQQLAFNTIPEVGRTLGDRTTDYEQRVCDELGSLLDIPTLACGVTAVFVPIFSGHAAAVELQLSRTLDVSEIDRLLDDAAGVQRVDAEEDAAGPSTIAAAERDEILVGRVRSDPSLPDNWRLYVTWDNLRQAALEAIRVTECLLEDGLV